MTSTDDDGSQRAELLLGPLLRHVDETSATVWVETSHPTSVSVLHATTDTFTVHGRHFALMVIEGLEPGTTTPYEVHLGGPTGRRVWPRPDSDLPPSVIRTPVAGRPVSILLGSCRAAAPHEPPYTLELTFDAEGRGVDALWAHGRRMLSQSPDAWPDLVLFLGDQIYADDSSPRARQRIARRRDDDATLPPEVVAGFEEYCWLYHEAWSAEVERWLLATVPSAMIMDDHDMIDDWNISSSWVDDIRREPWWFEHLLGGLMSYWVYQHLGNLSPDRIRAEGLLEQLIEAGDGTAILRAHLAPPSGDEPSVHPYRFSHCRRVGDVTAMVIDCRTARLLTENHRQMLHDGEWAWVRAELEAVEGHLLIGTSLPVFIADGLHDLQVWNERICAGAWGRPTARVGEWLRRSLDLEDWSAFGRSYHRFVDLIEELRHRPSGPQSIVVASGDIHFSYAAEVPPRSPVGIGNADGSRRTPRPVWQIVSSPIRNALIPPERGVLRACLTRSGRFVGQVLRAASGAERSRPGIVMRAGPFFANNMVELRYADAEIDLTIEQSTPDEGGGPQLASVAELQIRGTDGAHPPDGVDQAEAGRATNRSVRLRWPGGRRPRPG